MTSWSEQSAPEPAVAPGDDPRAFARVLSAVHHAAMAGERLPARPRSVIGESWSRARSAGVDPDSGGTDRGNVAAGGLEQLRETCGLAPVLTILTSGLESMVRSGDNIVVVAEAGGRVLWRSGAPQVLHRADGLGFTEGANWAERAVGTNAIGTGLALARPVQVFSAEHFVRSHHAWSCTSAPVRDPRTGAVLGVVDISGPAKTVHPTTLALVGAVAGLAEARLREHHRDTLDRLRAVAAPIMARVRRPALAVDVHGWVAAVDSTAPRQRVHLPAQLSPGPVWIHDLGACIAEPLPVGGWLIRMVEAVDQDTSTVVELTVDGGRSLLRVTGGMSSWSHHPSPRHTQILTALAQSSTGCTAAELALRLFGDPAKTITIRAEVSRLRKHLGGLISANPYRFADGVQVIMDAPASSAH